MPTKHNAKQNFLFIGALSALALLLFLAYFPSVDAPLTFDDAYSLQGLAEVKDLASAILYTLSGDTGPTGRPLALLSFVLNASSWPDALADFRYFNLSLHIINTLFVWLLTVRILAFMQPHPPADYKWIALIGAGLWGALPLLASTSISIVQRMTSLSASFVLVGLCLYVIGRSRLHHRPQQGLFLMALGIGTGTLLGVLSKENGALLALYAGVLEFTLFRHQKISSKPINGLAKALLIIPISGLLFYLIQPLFTGGYAGSYVHRSFTMSERLYTEAVILWDYLINAFFPRLSNFGPFHDDYPVYQTWQDPVVITTLIIWSLLCAGAILGSRRCPVFAFAVLWFLAGHILESSFIGLELYFEHRNYLPLIGPIFALIYMVVYTPSAYRRFSLAGLGAYASLQVFILWQLCSLWGQPLVAAEFWYKQHPHSSRAAQYLANFYGQSGDYATLREIILQAANRNPYNSDLQLQALALNCNFVDDNTFASYLQQTIAHLKEAKYSNATIQELNNLISARFEKRCTKISVKQMHNIIDALFENRAFSNFRLAQHHLHHLKSRLYSYEGLLNPAVQHLEKAFAAQPDLETAKLIGATLSSAGLTEEALKALNDSLRYAPRNAILNKHWNDEIAQFKSLLLDAKDS